MAHSSDIFTFTWKIENFSMLPQQVGEPLDSAVFVVETLDHSKWFIRLFPKGLSKNKNFISCCLRMDSGKSPIQLGFSFTLESTDMSCESLKTITACTFNNNERGYGCPEFILHSKLYENKHLYLPQDVFTLRCCMWPLFKMYMAPSNNCKPTIIPNSFSNHCSNRTRIEVEKKSFTWSISKISKLIDTCGKTSINIKSAMKDFPSIELSLSIRNSGERSILKNSLLKKKVKVYRNDIIIVSDEESEEKRDDGRDEELDDMCSQDKKDVEVVIRLTNWPIEMERLFVRCKMTVLSFDQQYQVSKEDTHLFRSNLEKWCFPSFLTIENLVDNKYIYIDDTLLLQCDFAFSRKDKYYNVEVPQYVPWNFCNKKAPKTNELKGSILQLYASENLCDVSIRAGLKTFPAHKTVLCARSSVFSAMFEIDMKEKNSNVVDIHDVEPEILCKFLRFLYSDILEEDLTFEDTCKLYSAADKYQVSLLKQQCSILLLSTLSVSSVCNVLVLADTHSDTFLMSVVHNFLRNHSTEVFHSEKWKSYKEHYPQLFGDIMIKIFMEE